MVSWTRRTYMVSYWWLISNIVPKVAPLWDVRLWNLGDIDFDLSRSPRSNLIVQLDCPYMSSYYCLVVNTSLTVKRYSHLNISPYLLSLGQNFVPPPRPTLTQGRFFSESNHFILVSVGRSPPKMKLIGEILYALCFYYRRTDTQTV